ncbi:gamma carbonic anhydrase family protein [Cupriavidus sp. USMAHM13]|uniref:Gamma carbonic anhydrase family protein n=1 Tax=Cupriavidus malaysiensis TaxID=367825 RepID=A0ABN4TQ33_9BURK|nr:MULTISPECIES: gamma carbonic anhydrase family protein [Cupriavidus]AOZ01738.1 gamma carbonic anhydrase family protein [Cupriavidus sp. USMAHM13]AOZ08514.1 gamma carbonic anhydrase family protein [Cupriavidus malaysiensis]
MPLYRLGGHAPAIAASAYVAAEATVIGRAELAAQASVWPGAVIRADNETICLGAGSNVQEGAVLHTDPGCPLDIGAGVTIGHQAMLHGCTVGDGSLVGIQAVILNRAVIGAESLVAAGALVTEGKAFPPRSLILGSPAKAVRTLSDEEVANLRANAEDYVRRAQAYRTELERIG